MSVSSIDFFVLDFTNTSTATITPPSRSRVAPNISFELISRNTVTLSSNTVNQGSDLEGLLYVPDLSSGSPCFTLADQYVPSNVTRSNALYLARYQFVALAPWFSPECSRAYLSAVQTQISAFVFYQTYDNATSNSAQSPTSSSWDLGDGGRWKSLYPFPVYAISQMDGMQIMRQSSLYSGSLEAAPFSTQLAEQYLSTDSVRIYATFTIGTGDNLPTLWAFLLIVLGIVLLIIGCTSLVMHFIQRRNRQDLRQRIERGEIDLAMIGVKKQRLNQTDIDALPLIPYVAKVERAPSPDLGVDSLSATDLPKPMTTDKPVGSTHDFNQPNCPICLDDYIPNETSVRSLPCHHIFHPDCIDRYLLSTSSLCPLCKFKIIPSATNQIVCPPITNAMVRRARYLRRMQEQRNASTTTGTSSTILSPGQRFTQRFLPFRHHVPFTGPPLDHASAQTTTPANDTTASPSQIEMGALPLTFIPQSDAQPISSPAQAQAAVGHGQTQVSPDTAPTDLERRREWARRRASALLGPGHERIDGSLSTIPYDRPERSRFRRGLAFVFPGFR